MATENLTTKISVTWTGQQQAYEISAASIDFEVDTFGNIIDVVVIGVTTDGLEIEYVKDLDYSVTLREIEFIRDVTPQPVRLILARITPPTNSFDFTENEPFPASEFTSAIDRLTFMVQALREQLNRTLEYPISDTDVTANIPAKDARALKYLSFDADGNPLAVMDAPPGNPVYYTDINGSVVVVTGDSSQRDGSPVAGYLRFNTDLNKFEGYNGTGWVPVGSGATGGGSDEVFVQNNQAVSVNYTLPAGKNAMSTGPVEIEAGVTVTIPSGSRWVIL